MASGFLCSAAALVTASQSSAATLSAEEMADLFSQGKELFRRANDLAVQDPPEAKDLYHKALMRFERIAHDGQIHNGKLYYNIGNTYFRLGNIGRAILYYRRAELFIRNDPILQQNLHYARSKRVDKVGEKQKAKVLKTLFFWHYDFSAKVRLALFALFFAAICIGASIRLFAIKASLGWGIAACGVLAALFFGSLVTEVLERETSGVILAPEVVARKGDGETYQPSFKEPLHAGTEFVLIEDRGDWHRIEMSDGRTCWVPVKAVGIVQRLSAAV